MVAGAKQPSLLSKPCLDERAAGAGVELEQCGFERLTGWERWQQVLTAVVMVAVKNDRTQRLCPRHL